MPMFQKINRNTQDNHENFNSWSCDDTVSPTRRTRLLKVRRDILLRRLSWRRGREESGHVKRESVHFRLRMWFSVKRVSPVMILGRDLNAGFLLFRQVEIRCDGWTRRDCGSTNAQFKYSQPVQGARTTQERNSHSSRCRRIGMECNDNNNDDRTACRSEIMMQEQLDPGPITRLSTYIK